VLNVQPDEGISISFNAKLARPGNEIENVKMDFSYQAEFGAGERSAYATLINDCMRGDATLLTAPMASKPPGRSWIPF
jgi:glucose-6-phosphate 1-dehydrogenase